MAEWYLAPSLVALRTEINRRWPNRNKSSDGAVGDTSHQARKSDHNPDWDSNGVVRATDTDKDGIDVQTLLNAVIGDHRVQYVIWNRHIYSRTYNWVKQAYNGSNPHTGHVHISIRHTKAAETDTSRWFPVTPSPEVDEMTPIQMSELKSYIDERQSTYAKWLLYRTLAAEAAAALGRKAPAAEMEARNKDLITARQQYEASVKK